MTLYVSCRVLSHLRITYCVHVFQIPLGIFDKSENITGELIEIMKELHNYVPGAHREAEINDNSALVEIRNSCQHVLVAMTAEILLTNHPNCF